MTKRRTIKGFVQLGFDVEAIIGNVYLAAGRQGQALVLADGILRLDFLTNQNLTKQKVAVNY